MWLQVRKRQMPPRPPVPEACREWVCTEDLDRPDQEPQLRAEITVLVEREAPDPDAPPEKQSKRHEKVSEVRALEDHPEVQDAWLDYLVYRWEPWAREMERWQEIQRVYEEIDFMRRRLEESEERYELVLALGLLQWRDSTGTTVERHLLTAPAEITLESARGVLSVTPATSFDKFRVELDMLELQDQPRLDGKELDELLEELETRVWDTERVAQILRLIANRARPDAQVDEHAWKPLDRADERFRILYAPALVLRERRPTAYEELITRFREQAEGTSSFPTTEPWERFIGEGERSDAATAQPEGSCELDGAPGRLTSPFRPTKSSGRSPDGSRWRRTCSLRDRRERERVTPSPT